MSVLRPEKKVKIDFVFAGDLKTAGYDRNKAQISRIGDLGFSMASSHNRLKMKPASWPQETKKTKNY